MYIRIKLQDIVEMDPIPVDVFIFLPLNSKFMMFAKKGQSNEKLKALQTKNIDNIFINYEDLKLYLDFKNSFDYSESNIFYSDYKVNQSGTLVMASELLKNIINVNEEINYQKLHSFIADVITICKIDDDSIIYYSLDKISPEHYLELKHSQKVASLAIAMAILKNIPPESLPVIGLASMMHEIPSIMMNNFEKYLESKKIGRNIENFKTMFKTVNVPSKAIKILNDFHSNTNSIESNIISKADFIVHMNLLNGQKIYSILTA